MSFSPSANRRKAKGALGAAGREVRKGVESAADKAYGLVKKLGPGVRKNIADNRTEAEKKRKAKGKTTKGRLGL